MIALYLMTLKGYRVLSTVIETFGKDIVEAVIAARDSNIENDHYTEIQALCSRHGIPFYNRKDNFTIESEYRIVISWRWMIHGDAGKLVVLHDSLLPKYRGFNPLVTALINGDTEIGVTALFANAEFDKGDIIHQSATLIPYSIKIAEAIDKVLECYVSVVKKVITDIVHDIPLPRQPQDEHQATYSLWRDEQDYEIDWEQSATDIKRFIDALGSPYKGAKTYVNGDTIRITDAAVDEDLNISNRTAGKVIFNRNNCLYVVCGSGILRIEKMTDDNGQPIVMDKTRIRFR